MNAIVLCGGRGSRIGGEVEKPLRRVGDEPMVARVADGLGAAENVDTVHAAVSPNAPETADWARDTPGIEVVETPGEGYVPDLGAALDAVGRPAVTAAADLPLLAGEHVDRAIDAGRVADVNDSVGFASADDDSDPGSDADADSDPGSDADADPDSGSDPDADPAPDADGTASVSVLTPARLKRRLGVSADEYEDGDADDWLPTGLNVVGDGEASVERRSWDARLAVNVNYEADLDAAAALLGVER